MSLYSNGCDLNENYHVFRNKCLLRLPHLRPIFQRNHTEKKKIKTIFIIM